MMEKGKMSIVKTLLVIMLFQFSATMTYAEPSLEYPNKSTVLTKDEDWSDTGTMVGKWKEFAGITYSSSEVPVKFVAMYSTGYWFNADRSITASPGAEFTQAPTSVKTDSVIWKLRLQPNPYGYYYPAGYGKGWMWLDM